MIHERIVYEAKDVKTKITLFVFRALMIHGRSIQSFLNLFKLTQAGNFA